MFTNYKCILGKTIFPQINVFISVSVVDISTYYLKFKITKYKLFNIVFTYLKIKKVLNY